MPKRQNLTLSTDLSTINPIRKLGRPTIYKTEYCQKLLDVFAEGGDPPEFCSLIGICERTFYYWKENHEEFASAFDYAETLAKNFYLKQLRNQGLSLEKYPNSNQLFTYVRQRWPDTYGKQNDGTVVNNYTQINNIDSMNYLELKEEFAKLTDGIIIEGEIDGKD